MIGTERAINVAKVASWLEMDFNWFVHILAYDFECGCKFEQSYDGREEVHCPIWAATIAKVRAEAELARAEIELQRTLETNKGMEVGR